MISVFQRKVVSSGRMPDWLMSYANKFYTLLDLQQYTVNIHYATLKTINRKLNKMGYASITKQDKAAIVIDPIYLFANIFFVAPMKPGYDSQQTVAHEFLHLRFRDTLTARLKALIKAAGIRFKDEDLIDMEETMAESLISVLDKLKAFDE
jgi:hypothetical protein